MTTVFGGGGAPVGVGGGATRRRRARCGGLRWRLIAGEPGRIQPVDGVTDASSGLRSEHHWPSVAASPISSASSGVTSSVTTDDGAPCLAGRFLP
jgi:hypothetical protein